MSDNIGWKLTEHDLTDNIRGYLDGNIEIERVSVAADANGTVRGYHPDPATAAVIRRKGRLTLYAATPHIEVRKTAFLGGEPSKSDKLVLNLLLGVCDGVAADLEKTAVISADAVRRLYDQAAKSAKTEINIHREYGKVVMNDHSQFLTYDADFQIKSPAVISICPSVATKDGGLAVSRVCVLENGLSVCGKQEASAFEVVDTASRKLKSARRSG